jgi:hypothetical protein
MYTFWDYKRNRWERDAGLRLDHLLLNTKAAKRLVDAGVDREARGLEGASDHAPAWIVLRVTSATRRKPARRSEKLTRPKSGKNIMRKGDKPADAILGFANMLLRLYREEQPRAVLVAWDTLETPMNQRAPLPSLRSQKPTTWEKAAKLAQKWGLNQLAGRLEELERV